MSGEFIDYGMSDGISPGDTYYADPDFYSNEYLAEYELHGVFEPDVVSDITVGHVAATARAADIPIPENYNESIDRMNKAIEYKKTEDRYNQAFKPKDEGLLGGAFDFKNWDTFTKQALVMTLVGAVGSGLSAVSKGNSDENIMKMKNESDQTLLQTQAEIKKKQIEANQPGRIDRTKATTLLTPESWKTDPLKTTQSGIINRQKGVPYGRTT